MSENHYDGYASTYLREKIAGAMSRPDKSDVVGAEWKMNLHCEYFVRKTEDLGEHFAQNTQNPHVELSRKFALLLLILRFIRRANNIQNVFLPRFTVSLRRWSFLAVVLL